MKRLVNQREMKFYHDKTQHDATKNKRAFSQLYEALARRNHQQSKTDNLDAGKLKISIYLLSTVGKKISSKINVF